MSSDRLSLIKTLSSLPPALFEQLVFALSPPDGSLPAPSAPQGERAAQLLNWVEGAGPGTHKLQAILNEVLGVQPPSQTAVCPYKGLSYFDCNDEDSRYFYGREALTQTLLQKVAQDNFLAIVGASGSGKSSVLRAGLLQRLKDGGNDEIRILVPGEHPLQNLALAFVDEALPRVERAKQQRDSEALIQDGAEGLRCLVQTSAAQRVVLVIDQFEEAFTLCQDPTEQQTFFATLLGGLAATSQLCLILAMRSDFVGKCFEQHYGGLAQKVEQHLTAILPMTPEELTQAITQPARQTGIALEPGLVETLLRDVEQSPGTLPLLQYTLTELWQRRQDNQLKLSTYAQFGGVTGTLKQRADEVYAALTPAQQETAKHIFLSLTQLGEGTEDTRRRVTQDTLISAKHSASQVADVLKRMADANLVVTDVDEQGDEAEGTRIAVVDIAHEALIRNWPQLRNWLEENRDLLRQQRKIELAAEEWSQQPQKKQNGYLLQGRQLTDAKAFRKKHGGELPLSKRVEDYLNRSLAHRRNNRFKLAGFGMVIPLGLASYAGVQVATYYRLQPHWDVINSYNADSNKIARAPLVRALQEINLAQRSLRSVSLSAADLSAANLSAADLSFADLRSADLSAANLRSADLSFANLRSANLSFASLRSADLSFAILSFADLSAADLSSADLRPIDLRFAILSDAILGKTDLRNTPNLTLAQLTEENSPYLCNVALPIHITTLDPHRDCDQLPQVLMEQYGLSPEDAEQRVNEMREHDWE